MSSSNCELTRLETYLRKEFPECVLIPCGGTSKSPRWSHKDVPIETLWHRWVNEGRNNCQDGVLLIMRRGLLVIDIDTPDMVTMMEAKFPVLRETAMAKTKKGRHYFFRRTEACDVHRIYDKARGILDPNDRNNKLDIDIKTVCSTGTGGALSVCPSPNKQWVRAPWDVAPLDLPQCILEFLIDNLADRHDGRPHQVVANERQQQSSSQCARGVDLAEVRELVGMLNPQRADAYSTWMEVGWCLHNIDSNALLDTWINFSKQSEKYEATLCDKLWQKMRDGGLGLGSLHMWARKDSPSEYKAMLNARVFDDIIDCNGSHNAVASIAHKLLKCMYVCATADGRLWYRFAESLWREDKGGICIRKELSSTVREQFNLAIPRVMSALSVDDLQSLRSSSAAASRHPAVERRERLLSISYKLQDSHFKDNVIKEMREFFYDQEFLAKLDSNINLLAFTNGVYDFAFPRFRASVPEDYVSLSVGYPYDAQNSPSLRARVDGFLSKLHPDESQREYVMKMLARQLRGDTGQQLFHVHAGHKGSAGNGKSTFFEALEHVLGDYVTSFKVSILTARNREEASKPQPEYHNWRGRRILYCTEPKEDDMLHSGIMKDLTGGEVVQYRMLFSNDIQQFRPQYKMHIMCNGPPKVDGADEGVKRRIRKIDYRARFVDAADVDETRHKYARDGKFIGDLVASDALKMAFMHTLLELYQADHEYTMPDCIREQSSEYLEENNVVARFVRDFVVESPSEYFTLSDARAALKVSGLGVVEGLKTKLESVLGASCRSQVWLNGGNRRNAFVGFKIDLSSS